MSLDVDAAGLTGINGKDIFSFTGAQSLTHQSTDAGSVANGEYMLIRGNYVGTVFTQNAGGTAALVLYDADPTGSVSTSGFVLIGCNPAEFTTAADSFSFS